MTKLTIATGNHPHQRVLKDGTVKFDGIETEFPEVKPITKAFANMARDLAYDVSEMAIVTYLMARDKDIPVTLFPIALTGSYHHQSLVRMVDSPPIEPKDLVGKTVGVRAYSQTTGLWVRGILQEEFGIHSNEITWLTNEGPHVIEYEEPAYVERTESSLSEMITNGDIVAAVTNPNSVSRKQDIELVSIIPNIAEREAAWGERHQTIPVNHMLTVQTQLLKSDPKAVKAVFQGFAEGIEVTKSERGDKPKDKAVTYGLNDQLMRAVDIAITYSLEQELITKKTSAEENLC